MRFLRPVLAVATSFAVCLAGSQLAAATEQSTGSVVQRALDRRGPEPTGPARPTVDVQAQAKSLTVSAAGTSHTITPTDRRNSVVRALPDGGQVITVLRRGDSTQYDLSLAPGWQLTRSGAGFLITKPGTELTGVIQAPWAIDAAGRSLRTWYETTSANRLVQHVDTTGARYPIAMDPKLTYGRGVYLNLTGVEVQGILSVIIGGGGVITYISCQGVAKLPVQLKKVVQVLCKVTGAAAAVTIRSILDALKSLGEIDSFACYQKRIVPNQGEWGIVNGKNCR
ncbi:hypothetical protein [Kribbella sp. CA-293567]|uniref:hypothetical protein n=1 Tax=Kribbella sp. CA-293567 TaxID=3002436 RepID=UPI0022DE6C7C|nr:hypothetical protein [Kribbella sp. CA-293567]WBQ04897.1 hypothetical protein OX958_33710 [Kribbella sp. CA-293567]